MSLTATPSTVDLAPGTWVIDPVHSDVSFTVRHLMVSKVRGQFTRFDGAIEIGEDPLASAVRATVDLTSIDTRDEKRDEHLRSADFFGVDKWPTMSFESTGVRRDGDDYVVDGDLSLHGVTRPVELRLEFHGAGADPWGGSRAGFSATTEINRRDFGIDFNIPIDGGGFVVGDKVKVALEVEAIRQA